MVLRIDTAKFKEFCNQERQFIERMLQTKTWTKEEFSSQSISEKKDWYDFERGSFVKYEYRVPPKKTPQELREELNVAASTAMGYGATTAQIDQIVYLAEKSGDYNILAGGRLTKREASNIIETMMFGVTHD